jgi:thiamine phosphate synthase YjbQ (UPF0047 family)
MKITNKTLEYQTKKLFDFIDITNEVKVISFAAKEFLKNKRYNENFSK